MNQHTNEDPRWLDDSRNVDKLWRGVCVVCVALVAVDLFYAKHGHYDFENLIGFHALYGFVAFVFIILAGRHLRGFLMREEDYYDD